MCGTGFETRGDNPEFYSPASFMWSKSFVISFVSAAFLLLSPLFGRSQVYSKYPFLKKELNHITNHRDGLRNFFMRLDQLEKEQIRTLNIVHIGDSHIQADWFSGKVRTLLQQKFGSAGRGLVFPYSVARTNSPEDISSTSNVSWQASRNIERSPSLPTGISGITLQTNSGNFFIKLSIDEGPAPLHYRFNKVTLFTESKNGFSGWRVNDQVSDYEYRQTSTKVLPSPSTSGADPPSPTYHIIKSGENLTLISRKYGLSVKELKELNDLEGNVIYPGKKLKVSKAMGTQRGTEETFVPSGSFMQQFYLHRPTRDVFLQGDQQGRLARLYGVVLENYHQSGILYHMIGVNGAKFENYNSSSQFHKHVQALKPDLIIISLGTNEAVNGYFNENRFYKEVDDLIHDLEFHNRFADILITTPPDSYKSKSYANPTVGKISNVLSTYATENDLACWNFYNLMGGSGSIKDWHRYYLAQNDKLHLTKPGYELQGKLLYEALIKGYESFRNRR